MRPLMYFLLGVTIAAVLIIPTANAATLVKQPDGTLRILQRNLDGTATYTNVREANGDLIVERNLGTKTIGAVQGARVPVTIDVLAKKPITKDLLARSLVKNMRLGLLGTVGVVVDVVDALDLHYDPTCNCIVQGDSSNTQPATSETIYKDYSNPWNPSNKYSSAQAAASGAIADQLVYNPNTNPDCRIVNPVASGTPPGTVIMTYNSQGSCGGSTGPFTATIGYVTEINATCPSGYTPSGTTCVQQTQQLTDDAAKDLIKLSDPPWPDFLDDLAGQGDGIDTSEVPDPSPEISPTPDSSTTITPTGPGTADLKSPKSIVDNGDGTRSEGQTTVHTVVEGDTINYTITNTTQVINNTTNQTVSTSNENNDGADLQTGVVTDTALPSGTLLFEMPEVPDFYEQKYPDGFGGEWDNFTDQMDQTPFFQLIDQLTPDWSGGQCPSWSMSFDLGFANYGTHVVEPPCWIFPYLKIIILVTALFVARGLVFGG